MVRYALVLGYRAKATMSQVFSVGPIGICMPSPDQTNSAPTFLRTSADSVAYRANACPVQLFKEDT